MNTLTSHRASERFARLIDLDAPVLQVSTDESPMRHEVALGAALRSAARIAAPAPLSAEARHTMRQQLVAAANLQAASAPPGGGITSRARATSRRVSRRASALVGSVAVVTSISGVGVAAAHSLPGSPFYDLKRATEAVQLWLASGPAAKGERHLDFARARLDEAQALGPDSRYTASTLRAMNQETREGSTDLINAYRSSGENDPLADLVAFTREQYAELARFGEAAGDQLRAQTTYSLTLLTGVAQQVESVSGTTCLKCIVSGQQPKASPTPRKSTSPSPSPTATRSTTPSSPAPSASPSKAATHRPGLLPTGILPTELPTLPPLLNHKTGKKSGGLLPTLSPLPLLSTLTNLLSGR
ncbi:MAG TPA: DUF5667 domain-containing protein [Mycobacteriales bacterium]|nr:DUF5667 domain-containing protein [Mycobacteriales bacterium]